MYNTGIVGNDENTIRIMGNILRSAGRNNQYNPKHIRLRLNHQMCKNIYTCQYHATV